MLKVLERLLDRDMHKQGMEVYGSHVGPCYFIVDTCYHITEEMIDQFDVLHLVLQWR